ncbi:hypothetical protein [Nostoc sp. PCC 7107]|uniref:hypothetical protein n=1 Tax=Nostoc sp. PCC 7107 TaxID=317936 RepID=UPI00155A603A|nr:hypothetical protein [Nostoc sp. PCC 7107]
MVIQNYIEVTLTPLNPNIQPLQRSPTLIHPIRYYNRFAGILSRMAISLISACAYFCITDYQRPQAADI